jgi:predicted metalloprotease with PDZ domain
MKVFAKNFMSFKNSPPLTALLIIIIHSPLISAHTANEQSIPNKLVYVLDLTLSGENSQFHVDLYFKGDSIGLTKLKLPAGWQGQSHLYNAITRLSALSADTKIADTAEPYIKTITYPPHQTVHIQYDVVQDWSGSKVKGGIFNRAILQRDYFYFIGDAFWVYPDWDQKKPITVKVRWKNIPKAWALNNSFDGNKRRQTVKTSLTDFRKGVYLGGDFRVTAVRINGKPIYVATRGRWKFPDEEFNSLVQKVVGVERAFWHDNDFPHFLVVLFPTDDPAEVHSGEARTNSFVLYLSREVEHTSGIKQLLAHEMFHTWNPYRLGELEDQNLYWFTEGFTDYYSLLLLLRGGLISLDEYVNRYNEWLKAYYTSPVRNITNKQIREERGANLDVERQSYLRGSVLAQDWDSLIRAATGNQYALDDAMRDLFKAARVKGFVLSRNTINEAVSHYVKRGVQEEIEQYIENGVTIPLTNDVPMPCLEMQVVDFAIFDAGFDVDASYSTRVFTGVREDGPAYKAGMRNGQKWVESEPGLVRGNPTFKAGFIVEESGVRKQITYYPVGDHEVYVPQYRIKAEDKRSGSPQNSTCRTHGARMHHGLLDPGGLVSCTVSAELHSLSNAQFVR